jgi:hypothetical protein
MLADQLDYVVGVDPHRDSHALAVVEVVSGVVVFESTVTANNEGYARALELADRLAPGRRAFAIEGTGSFGAGLTRFLTGRDELVVEVGRLRRERRSGGRPTRSTPSVPPAACSASRGRRHRGRAVNVRRCRHLWLLAREPSTPNAPGSASSATC